MTTRQPTAEQTLRKLYHQLMAGNLEAFAAEQYDVAYHALMAALHCAQPLKDVHALEEVERIAAEQLTEIDARHPEYQHSTRSAATRGHESIFATLRRQAGARRHMWDLEAQKPTSITAPPDAEAATESIKK
jgi:hypothetical protein